MDRSNFERSFAEEDLKFLYSFAEIINKDPLPEEMSEAYMKANLQDAEVALTCWGTPMFTEDVLAAAPNLRLILHAAGTPKAIVSDAVWERQIRVATAAPVIAIDVAETALGAMIMLGKRFPQYEKIMANQEWGADKSVIDLQKQHMTRLNYRTTVGVISASHVGKNMIRFLKPFGVRILLYDPFVTKDQAREMGVFLVGDLVKLFTISDIVTCHAPKLDSTYHLIDERLLSLMHDGAVFVNTSRGSCVDEEALIRVLKTGRIFAYLDVFDKEPLPAESELYHLDNVILTPHISGGHTVNGGYERGNYIVTQLYTYVTRGYLKDETSPFMIPNMA